TVGVGQYPVVHWPGTPRREPREIGEFYLPRDRRSGSRHLFKSDLARRGAAGHDRQLGWIEQTALLLVVRIIRLRQDVAQEAELVGPIEDWPDVAIEERPGFGVPGEPTAVAPLAHLSFVAEIDALRAVEAAEPSVKPGLGGEVLQVK